MKKHTQTVFSLLAALALGAGSAAAQRDKEPDNRRQDAQHHDQIAT